MKFKLDHFGMLASSYERFITVSEPIQAAGAARSPDLMAPSWMPAAAQAVWRNFWPVDRT